MTDPFGALPEAPPEPEPTRAATPRAPRARMPRLSTVALLSILAAFFVAEMIVSGDIRGDDGWTLFRLGALWWPAVRAGDFWRIGSYAFLHIGLIHLVMNGAALWALMPQVEATFGPNLAIGLFAATALAGGAGSVFWAVHGGPIAISAGASGGIFGLFGATIALFWRIRDRIPAEARRQIVRGILLNIGLNAAIALAAPVDSAAHVAGAISGVLLGLAAPLPTLPDRLWHRPVRWALIASALALFAMEGIGVAWAVRPKPRTLRGEGVVATIPGTLVPVGSGTALNPEGVELVIARVNADALLGERVRIGARTFTRITGERSTQLATAADGGAIAVVLTCHTVQCEGAAGESILDTVAATLQPAKR